MQSFALFLSIFSLFFACKSGPRHSTPTTPVTAPPTSAAAIDTIHYFDLAPTQTPFDATKLQSVDYTLSAVQQGSQTGIHISIATPLDPNSDFFRMSVCTDSNCSDPQRIQQEFAPAIWDYYPAPDLQGVLTVEVQACIDPARAKDPAVTCGPIQTKVWKQVANPDDAAAKSMQTFQAERSGFQSDCEQARTLVNTYLQANPTPPSAPEALRFYNLAKNFSFMDPHACASLIRSGELWTIDAALQQNGATPAASQSLELAETTPSTEDILATSAIAAGTISILSFVGAYQAWNTERNSANIKIETTGTIATISNTTGIRSAFGNIDAVILKTIQEKLTKLDTGKTITEMTQEIRKAEIATIEAIETNITKQKNLIKTLKEPLLVSTTKITEAITKAEIEIGEQSKKKIEIETRSKSIEEIKNVRDLVKYQLKASLDDAISKASNSTTTVDKIEKSANMRTLSEFHGEILSEMSRLNPNASKEDVQKVLKNRQEFVKTELNKLNESSSTIASNKQKIATTSNKKLPTGSNKWAKASAGFGIIFAVAAVVLGVLSTQLLAADTATTSQQALLDQFATLRTQIDARMDRYLAAYVHEVETN